MSSTHQSAIAQAEKFLIQMSNNGSFPIYISNFRDMRDATLTPQEVGSSAFYLNCLGSYYPNAKLTHQVVEYLKSRILPDMTVCFTEDLVHMPSDNETSSFVVGLLLERGAISTELAQKTANQVLDNKNEQGKLYMYFEREDKPDRRLDHVSALNMLTFLGQLGHEKEVSPTIAWIDKILDTRSFYKGSRYYHSPSSFFYFAARLCHQVPHLGQRWITQLQKELSTYNPDPRYPIELSAYLIAQNWLKVPYSSTNVEILKSMQKPNGAWSADSLYHLGTTERYFGSEIMSTLFAVQALIESEEAF